MAGFWRYSEIPLRFRGTCRSTEQRAAHYFGHEECMHMTRRVFVLPPKCMCLLYILRKFPCYTTADFYIWLFFSGACLYKARKSDRSASLLTDSTGCPSICWTNFPPRTGKVLFAKTAGESMMKMWTIFGLFGDAVCTLWEEVPYSFALVVTSPGTCSVSATLLHELSTRRQVNDINLHLIVTDFHLFALEMGRISFLTPVAIKWILTITSDFYPQVVVVTFGWGKRKGGRRTKSVADCPHIASKSGHDSCKKTQQILFHRFFLVVIA